MYVQIKLFFCLFFKAGALQMTPQKSSLWLLDIILCMILIDGHKQIIWTYKSFCCCFCRSEKCFFPF